MAQADKSKVLQWRQIRLNKVLEKFICCCSPTNHCIHGVDGILQ